MYCFILGRTPDLSIAELGSLLGSGVEAYPQKGVVFFDGKLPGGVTPSDFMKRLGGTVEIVEIIESGVSAGDVEKVLVNYLRKKCEEKDVKCYFAVNEFPEKSLSKVLKFILPQLKKTLKAEGLRAYFMNKNFKNISRVFAASEGLDKKGTNLNIIEEGDGKVSVGFSVAFQDVDAYSLRDYSKPFRDAKVGMLPPKVAQMMVNIGAGAVTKGAPIIYDPFCGTGTVLIEGLLAGHSVMGSDIDGRMAKGATENISWAKTKFPISKNAQDIIFQKSATDVSDRDLGSTTSLAIVSEPHLGPPLAKFPFEVHLERIINETGSLYEAFLKNFASWLPKGTPLVIIFPSWKKGPKEYISLFSRLVDKIEHLGYSKTTFAPLQVTSLIYDRPDQVVAREIVRLVKN